MNLLINEPPLQVLPSLAKEIGLNEAIVVQQIHYWIRISRNEKDGFKWVYKTFAEWKEEFPFWHINTIKRTIKKLEDDEIIFSSKTLNKAGYDRTKWYRINYEKLLDLESTKTGQSIVPKWDNAKYQNGSMESIKMGQCITREYTENTTENNNVVKHDNASAVYKNIVDYLNAKSSKSYRHTTKKTQQLIKARLAEGFTVDDFRTVIDKKVSEWKGTDLEQYIRPETLFGTKFESYLQQVTAPNKTQKEYKVPQNANKPFDFGE